MMTGFDDVMITPNQCSRTFEVGISNYSSCPTPMPTPFSGPNGSVCVPQEVLNQMTWQKDAITVACLCMVVGILWGIALVYGYKYYKEHYAT
jgi:hypothetical protein